MNRVDFLSISWDWRFAAIVAAAFIIWCIFDWQAAKGSIYQLMLLAKSKAKDAVLNSGQEQEDWVVKNVWTYIPLKFKIFLNEDTIRKIIKWLYKQAKDKLDDGSLNGSM